jgi:hypothetical protein
VPLKPDVQALLEQFEAQGLTPFNEVSVPGARMWRARSATRGEPGPVAPESEASSYLARAASCRSASTTRHPAPLRRCWSTSTATTG